MTIGRLAAIAALAFAAHAISIGGPFLYDDVTEIQTNPRVHSLGSIPSLLTTEFWYGVRGRGILYRPVTAATIPPLFVLGGGSPALFHAANLLLHALGAALLAWAAFLLTRSERLGFIAGALFAVHPAHAEAVAWISGRSELLFATAGAAAWAIHLWSRERRSWAGAVAAAILLALSLGSKETGICWIPLFAAGDWLFPQRAAARPPERRFRIGAYALYAAVLIAWAAARWSVLGQIGRRPEEGAHLLNPLEGEAWWPARPWTALRVLGTAAAGAVFPGRGCIDYGFDQIPIARGPLHADILMVIALLAAAVFLTGRALLRRGGDGPSPAARALLLSFALFLVSWFPASNFLIPSVAIFAERNLYLPLFGVCLAAAAVVEMVVSRRVASSRSFRAGFAALLLLLGSLALSRASVFRDPVALFENNTRVCPDSARGHFLLGAEWMDTGRSAEAAAAYRRALAIAPEYADARADLARALARAGDLEGAAREAREALRTAGPGLETRLAVAAALSDAGLRSEAEDLLADLQRRHGDDDRVLFVRAEALKGSGRLEEARALYESIRDARPGSPVGYDGIGSVLALAGDVAGAREAFERALTIDAYDPSALYNLGLIALTESPPSAAGAAEARSRFERYLRIRGNDPLAWMRMAEAQERSGEWDRAEASYRRAVDLAPRHPRPRKALEEFLARRAGSRGGP